MYDTARGLLTAAPEVAGSPGWGTIVERTHPATGERHTTHILNTEAGLHLTLLNGITLTAERSLPKALRGSNVAEIDQADVADALAKIDAEIGDALRVELPPFGSWQPTRVDYPRNLVLGSEDAVRSIIGQLRDTQLPWKGRPVAGDSGTSVAWGHGNHRVKVYGKLEESGDAGATGVLRVEVEARRLSTFRKYLGRERGAPVQLLDVLTPEVRDQVLARFADMFERCVMSERELTNQDFVQEFVELFGTRRTFELLGFCLTYRLAGFPTAREVREGRSVFPFTKSSVYRSLADLRRFRQHMLDQGYRHPALAPEVNRQEEGLDELADERRLIDFLGTPAPRVAA